MRAVSQDLAGYDPRADEAKKGKSLSEKRGGSKAAKDAVHKQLQLLARKHGLKILPTRSTLSMALRGINREMFYAFIQMIALEADHPHHDDAVKLWMIFDSLAPTAQKQAIPDDLCYAAGVSPRIVVEMMAGIAFDHNLDVGNLLAALSHPEIVAKTIQIAKTREGSAERKMLLDHMGFLPQPKGVVMQFARNLANINQLEAPRDSPPEMPSFADDIHRLDAVTGEVQKQLAEGVTPDRLVLDGEVLVPVLATREYRAKDGG